MPQIVLEKDMGKFKILSVLDDNGAVKKTLLIGTKWLEPLTAGNLQFIKK